MDGWEKRKKEAGGERRFPTLNIAKLGETVELKKKNNQKDDQSDEEGSLRKGLNTKKCPRAKKNKTSCGERIMLKKKKIKPGQTWVGG